MKTEVTNLTCLEAGAMVVQDTKKVGEETNKIPWSNNQQLRKITGENVNSIVLQ